MSKGVIFSGPNPLEQLADWYRDETERWLNLSARLENIKEKDMTEHYNGLTPAEAERLAMLIEEAGEIVQIGCKILRHGYESSHPETPDVTNRQLLAAEFNDLLAVAMMMELDFPQGTAKNPKIMRVLQKLRYTHHQPAPWHEDGGVAL